MGGRWGVGFLTLALLVSTVFSGHDHEGLELSEPQEVFSSEGGSVELWSPEHRALQDASVAVARVTLERRGLGLFKYSNAAQLIYILKGRGKVGLSYPWKQETRSHSAKKGDVIAIPRGTGYWCYNDGDHKFVGLSVADTSRGGEAGEYDSFYLHGGSGKEGGSILHAFDEDLLGQAWDVDRDTVKKMRESQKGRIIIKVKDDIHFRSESGTKEESEEFWENFIYNIDEAEPDVEVDNGGAFRLLNQKRLPILSKVHLAAARIELEREALFAPAYTSNGHILVYVTKGKGRIQIVGTSGQLLDSEVEEGTLVVVPQFHPAIKKAGDDCFEMIAIVTHEMPFISFLAGKKSIYKGVPAEVLAAGNNVDVEVEEKILSRRTRETMIFPPRQKSSFSAETVRRQVFGELKEILGIAHIGI